MHGTGHARVLLRVVQAGVVLPIFILYSFLVLGSINNNRARSFSTHLDGMHHTTQRFPSGVRMVTEPASVPVSVLSVPVSGCLVEANSHRKQYKYNDQRASGFFSSFVEFIKTSIFPLNESPSLPLSSPFRILLHSLVSTPFQHSGLPVQANHDRSHLYPFLPLIPTYRICSFPQ